MHASRTSRSRARFAALLLGASLVAAPASAQEPPDSIAARLERLSVLVDSLRQEVARLRAEGREEDADDALSRLRAAAEQAAAAGPEEQDPDDEEFVGRQRSLQALNPEISVNADLFGHVNQDAPRQDNFFAREFELSLQSSLDPFSRAKVFISRHVPGGELEPFPEGEDGHAHEEEGAGFSVEEGYVEWVGLPAGIGLKVGKFYQHFGQLNRWHAHALPFQSRSLPHLAYIGEEPLAQTGASVRWLFPFGGSSGTYEATLEVTRSENELLFGESGRISALGHLNGFWNLSESLDLDLGLSWINGSYEDETSFFDRNLYGVETALTWRPPTQSRYRSFTLRGGVMVLDGLVSHDEPVGGADQLGEGRALGFWSSGELRLTQQWYVGARFDRTESPEDPDETAWLLSPTLTWWQSEWVRLRVEYDLVDRGLLTDREGRFLLQLTFAMGPHKHETY